MDTERFWQIIDESRQPGDDSPEAQLESLRALVDVLPPDEVVSFQEHFEAYMDRAYTWELWAAAFILGGGCSDDGFMDFRASLICRGEQVFNRAVEDPDSLAELELEDPETDCFFEGFQYVPMEIYEAKSGKELPPRKTPHPSEPAGTSWEENSEDLKRICPRLWAKHGWSDA